MEFESISGGAAANIGGAVKKQFKDKKFLIAAGVVGVAALAYGIYKNKTSSDTDSGTVSYTGYPITGSGGGTEASYDYSGVISDFQGYYDTQLAAMEESYSERLQSVIDSYDQTIGDMSSQIDSLSGQLATVEEANTAYQQTASKNSVIDQMRANSDLFWLTDNQATKDALHAENVKLAESIGLTYDSESGSYYDGDTIAYTTALQSSMAEGKKASSATVAFDNNIDYQKEINNALLNGSSAATVDTLNAARNAKIAASGSAKATVNAMYDPDTDYSVLISNAKKAGASQDVIDNLTAQRNAKIDANPDLEKYRETK